MTSRPLNYSIRIEQKHFEAMSRVFDKNLRGDPMQGFYITMATALIMIADGLVDIYGEEEARRQMSEGVERAFRQVLVGDGNLSS
jgi:hypothetical protein